MKKIRILIVDDHTVVREGLKVLLNTEADFEVVAEAENGREAILEANKSKPDIVLMDVAMPLLNGIEATRQIKKNRPEIRVIALTAFGDDDTVHQMLDAGCDGFLLKQTSLDDMLKAIGIVSIGKTYCSPAVMARLRELDVDLAQKKLPLETPAIQLTHREKEVIQLIAEGFSNKQIAAELHLKEKTVEHHRGKVMKKLCIHNASGLTRYAVSKGMVEHNWTPRQIP